jgi:hypothetical protein
MAGGTSVFATVMIEWGVYKTVLQRARWALPRPICILIYFSELNNTARSELLRITESKDVTI